MAKYTSEWCIPVIELTPGLRQELKDAKIAWRVWRGYILPFTTFVPHRVTLEKHSAVLEFLLSDEYADAVRSKIAQDMKTRT